MSPTARDRQVAAALLARQSADSITAMIEGGLETPRERQVKRVLADLEIVEKFGLPGLPNNPYEQGSRFFRNLPVAGPPEPPRVGQVIEYGGRRFVINECALDFTEGWPPVSAVPEDRYHFAKNRHGVAAAARFQFRLSDGTIQTITGLA